MSDPAPQTSAEALFVDFVNAFRALDYDRLGGLLDENLVSLITNAEGGATELLGRAAYIDAVRSVDYASARLDIRITQILTVKPGQALAMVEIKAERKGRDLHNFAAFLVDADGGAIKGLRMVEALPAYSDAFWKD